MKALAEQWDREHPTQTDAEAIVNLMNEIEPSDQAAVVLPSAEEAQAATVQEANPSSATSAPIDDMSDVSSETPSVVPDNGPAGQAVPLASPRAATTSPRNDDVAKFAKALHQAEAQPDDPPPRKAPKQKVGGVSTDAVGESVSPGSKPAPKPSIATSMESFANVPSQLRPRIHIETLARWDGDTYISNEEEDEKHDLMERSKAVLVSALQRDLYTAIRLQNRANLFVVPGAVLIDSGADIGIGISRAIAEKLALSWDDNFTMHGIGGSGGCLGRATESICIRIGGNGRKDDRQSRPRDGTFAVWVQPVVLTDEVCRGI